MLYFANGAKTISNAPVKIKLVPYLGLSIALSRDSIPERMTEKMKKTLVLLLIALPFAGCTHLGTRLERHSLPEGAPSIEAVLADLARNDAVIANFKARGKFTLKTPELETIYLLHQSDIVFQRPDYLSVIGRKYASTVLRLTCAGPEFLLELPTERAFCYRAEGEAFSSVSFRVSPVDIFREAFLPEDWAKLNPAQVVMTSYDAATQTAHLEVYAPARARRPHRRLEVQGAPWVVSRSELLDKTGAVVAETVKSDYQVTPEGVRFPVRVESTFPGEQAFMYFDMRKFSLNEPAEKPNRDIRGRADALHREGYEEIEPLDKRGGPEAERKSS